MFDSLSFTEELVGGLLDASLGDLVVDVEAGDGHVLAVLTDSREGEHKASGDSVELTVGLESNGLPVVRSVNPVAHMVDGGVTSGSSGGELSELNNLASSLLDTGGEFVRDP